MKATGIKAADSKRRQYIRDLLKKDKTDLKFCVPGAGHGGLAMAAHLAMMDFPVNIFNRGKKKIRPLAFRKSIKIEGEIKGIGTVEMASNQIEECLDGVDILMVAVPANGHRYMARTCAPHLKEKQIVILNPGRTGGTLEFLQALK